MLLNQMSPQITLELAEDERWVTVQRIVDSPHFCKSPRLSRLLLYLSEQTLLDRADLLTELNIAIMVFDRQARFDPCVDTIVRSHMVRLRQKLDQYATENPSSIQVTIPRGEYVVRFEQTAPKLSAQIAITASPSVAATLPGKQPRLLLLLCYLLGIMVLALLAILASSRRKTAEAAIAHPLWSRLFQPQRTTIFVAADSGLVLLHGMTAKNTTLSEYLTRDFSRETQGLPPERIAEILNMANHRYTSFVDLNMFRRIEHLPFASSGRLEVKYARDIQINELKQGNIILSGARGANPWLELYEPEMNFVGANDGIHHDFTFLNRHPQAGEATAYSASDFDPEQKVLGVLAFLPNLDGNGNALIVEGNSIAGTEAISDFLFDDAALLAFLDSLRTHDATIPHFEVLIESNSVNGSAGPFHVLAYRTHP
jgi:hypothetical protein